MFLTYDMEMHERQRKAGNEDKNNSSGPITIERFFNKDQNFSIAWYPSLKDYYNYYM